MRHVCSHWESNPKFPSVQPEIQAHHDTTRVQQAGVRFLLGLYTCCRIVGSFVRSVLASAAPLWHSEQLSSDLCLGAVRQSVRVRPEVKVVVMLRLLWRPCRVANVHPHFFTNCEIVFLLISFKCLIESELEYSGLKDVRTFNSELTNSITIGIVVLVATSS